jgi:hypothetical protein
VAAGDIGAIGFFSKARSLDPLGLISPQVVAYSPLADEAYVISFAVSSQAIDDLRPDYVVVLEVYGREMNLKDPRFLHAFTSSRRSRRTSAAAGECWSSEG